MLKGVTSTSRRSVSTCITDNLLANSDDSSILNQRLKIIPRARGSASYSAQGLPQRESELVSAWEFFAHVAASISLSTSSRFSRGSTIRRELGFSKIFIAVQRVPGVLIRLGSLFSGHDLSLYL